MKQILMAAALLAMAPLVHAKNLVVTASYYGTSDFHVTQPDWTRFDRLNDTVTVRSDGPGMLFLQLDDGTLYHSASGEITLTGRQLGWTKRVRCSLVTSEGELLGWQATHDDAAGFSPPDDGNALIVLLLQLLFLG